MQLPATREDFDSFLIVSENMDSDSPWCRNMSIDKIIEEIFIYAKEYDSDYNCNVFYYDNEYDEYDEVPIGMISLSWDNITGFSASLAIQYSNNTNAEYFKINLDSVPMKRYGKVELYDFDEIMIWGIELFNSNFDKSKYHD